VTLTFVEPKLLRGLRTKLGLLVACLAILLLGALSRPPAAPRPGAAEKVAPILEARAEREEPLRLLEGLRQRGQRGAAASFALQVSRARTPLVGADYGPVTRPQAPAGRGVVVEDSFGLTVASALEGSLEPRVTLASGSVSPARVRAHDVDSGLVLLLLAAPSMSAPLSTRRAAPGDLVLAAFGEGEHATLRPVFVAAIDGRRVSLSGASALVPGTPLFDLDGKLLALATGDREAALAAPTLEALKTQADAGPALPSTLGLSLQEPDEGLRARLGAGAAVVVYSDPEGPGKSLTAGDVLLGVGGQRVVLLDEAQRRIAGLEAGREARLTVRRGGRELEVRVTPVPALAYARQPVRGAGARADTLFAPEALAAAALPGHARVLLIEGRAPGPRPPRPGRSAWLLVEAELQGERFLAAVRP